MQASQPTKVIFCCTCAHSRCGLCVCSTTLQKPGVLQEPMYSAKSAHSMGLTNTSTQHSYLRPCLSQFPTTVLIPTRPPQYATAAQECWIGFTPQPEPFSFWVQAYNHSEVLFQAVQEVRVQLWGPHVGLISVSGLLQRSQLLSKLIWSKQARHFTT